MGDFSRDTFNKLKHYVGVRLQQGVPLVDADWNEQEDIRKYELQAFLKHLVGNGVPQNSEAFRILPSDRLLLDFNFDGYSPGGNEYIITIDLENSTAATPLGFDSDNSQARFGKTRLIGTAVAPFKLIPGMTLELDVSGSTTRTITFEATDFVDIAATTTDEVVAAINAAVERSFLTAFRHIDKDDFYIKSGYCLVDGQGVMNETGLRYSQQKLHDTHEADKLGVEPLLSLATLPPGGYTVYLDVWEREVNADEDEELINPSIGIETSVRLKREWVVRVGRNLTDPPSGPIFHTLAVLPKDSDGHVRNIKNLRQDYAVLKGIGTKTSGEASTAIGKGTTASEEASTAMGVGTKASGKASTAIGKGTTASGKASTAMGDGTTASRYASTAMGHKTEAGGIRFKFTEKSFENLEDMDVPEDIRSCLEGLEIIGKDYFLDAIKERIGEDNYNKHQELILEYAEKEVAGSASTAMGQTTKAWGPYSTAMGLSTTASEMASTAMGRSTEARGHFSTAMGHSTKAMGPYSTAMGHLTEARGSCSTAMGSRTTATSMHSAAAGYRAKANHKGTFVWADSKDAVFVSTGENQFLIRAAGGVGIGTNNPNPTQREEPYQLYVKGDVYIEGTLNGEAVDYAEYFESLDGQEIPVGTSVVLEKEKIRPAQNDETPIGVISANSMIAGGVHTQWPQKYLRDEFGNPVMETYKEEIMVPKKEKGTRERQKTVKKTITETVTRPEVVFENGKYLQKKKTEKITREVEEPFFEEVDLYDETGQQIIGKHQVPVMETYEEEIDVLDENGQPVLVGTGKFETKTRPKLNPEYDESREYIPRENRPEWNCVGLLGQLPIRKGQPVAETWVKIKDISENAELWLVK